MNAESVTTTPTISVPADMFRDKYEKFRELCEGITGAEGVLSLVNTDDESDTPRNRAIHAAWQIVRNCCDTAYDMDWPFHYVDEARRAAGITEDAA